MNRKLITAIHLIAATLALSTILIFWTSTIFSISWHDPKLTLNIKTMILAGMIVLIPAMIITGASGFKLAGNSKNKLILIKKKRMLCIALNGILILVPCAIILYLMANKGYFTKFTLSFRA